MHKGRLEAFSDGVIAIIITIMVLELRPPGGVTFHDLYAELGTKFLTYAISFVYVAIYWNNHHHMFQSVQKVNGSVLWANMHLLFWLSTIPVVTAWLGESGVRPAPVAAYGIILFLDAIAYTILVAALLKVHGHDSHFAKAIGSDFKGKISLLFYALAIALSFFVPVVSCGIFALVAAIWLVPDKRFVRKDDETEHA